MAAAPTPAVAYLGFGTYYGAYGKEGRSGCSGYLEADALEVEVHPPAEVVVAVARHPVEKVDGAVDVRR